MKNGLWLPFSKNVLVTPATAAEFMTRAAASLLYAGSDAALTGQSALVLHGCLGADSSTIHVLVPYSRKVRSRPGTAIHHADLDPESRTEVDGLATLTLEAALAEQLCRGQRHAAMICADQVLAMMPETEREHFRFEMSKCVRARADSRGVVRARFLLGLATGRSESPAESQTLLNIADAGLPLPTQQFVVRTLDGYEVYRLDFAWPECRVCLEYDGYEAHEQRGEMDAARDSDLRRRGWLVIRASAADLRNPQRMIEAVRSALRARGIAA